MAILPEDIPTGKVTGQFYFVNEDTIEDPDQYPQLTMVTGFVRFNASIKVLRMSARKAVVIPLTFDAKFNSEGKLVPADHLDSPEGILLPATDSTEFDTTGWTWTATFELKDAVTGHTIQIDPITFQVPVGSELDLSTIVPAPASPGVITTRGPQGEQGDVGPQGATGPQGEQGPQGQQGLPGNATLRVDTTAGKQVFISDGTTEHMVSGDTGWRDIRGMFEGLNDPKYTANTLKIRRTNTDVWLEVAITSSEVVIKNATILKLYSNLPAQIRGFSFSGNYNFTAGKSGNSDLVLGTLYTSAYMHGQVLGGDVSAGGFRVVTSFKTSDPWPTTLPGTPA